MVMEIITLRTDPRVSAISAMAKRIGGMDIMPSITRMMIASAPRTKPEINPIVMPMSAARVATENPTSKDTRVPYSTRE